MGQLVCPKCGFLQEADTECQRCGIIFERYRRPHRREPAAARGSAGLLRRLFRVLRWALLGLTALALILILRPSAPPQINAAPDASERAAAKVKSFQSAVRYGQASTMKLDEAELNGWLKSNLAMQPAAAPPAPVQTADPKAEPTTEEVQSSVRDVKIKLAGAHLTAYVLFDFHGVELSLMLEGRLLVEDGRLKLEPTGGKLGSLPLTQTILKNATCKLFDAPENREKFRLPSEIREIRVEGGELIVSSR